MVRISQVFCITTPLFASGPLPGTHRHCHLLCTQHLTTTAANSAACVATCGWANPHAPALQANLTTIAAHCTRYNNHAPYMCTAVDTKTALPAGQLLEAVNGAEREQSAAPGEIPLGEWAATRVRPSLALHSLTTQLQLTHSSAQVSSAPQYPPLDKTRGGEGRRVSGRLCF